VLVQVPESVQVNFHLQVRKADLALVSMKELVTLMKDMERAMKVITSRDYLVKTQVIIDGVMISTNA